MGLEFDDDALANAPVAGRSVESQVLDAFVAQHYLNVPMPPSLVVSAPVDKQLLRR